MIARIRRARHRQVVLPDRTPPSARAAADCRHRRPRSGSRRQPGARRIVPEAVGLEVVRLRQRREAREDAVFGVGSARTVERVDPVDAGEAQARLAAAALRREAARQRIGAATPRSPDPGDAVVEVGESSASVSGEAERHLALAVALDDRRLTGTPAAPPAHDTLPAPTVASQAVTFCASASRQLPEVRNATRGWPPGGFRTSRLTIWSSVSSTRRRARAAAPDLRRSRRSRPAPRMDGSGRRARHGSSARARSGCTRRLLDAASRRSGRRGEGGGDRKACAHGFPWADMVDGSDPRRSGGALPGTISPPGGSRAAGRSWSATREVSDGSRRRVT